MLGLIDKDKERVCLQIQKFLVKNEILTLDANGL